MPSPPVDNRSAPNYYSSPTPLLRVPRKSNGPLVISLLGKVGSSKTTTVIELAGIAGFLRHRVLILDTDPQRSASGWRSLRNDGSVAV